VTAYGIQLEPLTLGHVRLLSSMGIDGTGGSDGVLVSMLCSRPAADAARWLQNPLWRVRLAWRCVRIGWMMRRAGWAQEQTQALSEYLQAGTKGPTVIIEGQSSNSDAPVWESVLVSLMRDLSLTEAQADALELTQALLWYYVAKEQDGLCRVVNADLYRQQADELDAVLREKFKEGLDV